MNRRAAMDTIPVRIIRSDVLLVILLAPLAGCANTGDSKIETAFSDVPSLYTDEAKSALRDDLVQFIEYVETEIEATADQIMDRSPAADVRKAALLWKVEIIPLANEALAESDPVAAAYCAVCRERLAAPPEAWEGVWVATVK